VSGASDTRPSGSPSALRVLVSFKVTPDFEALRPGYWAAGAVDPSSTGPATAASAAPPTAPRVPTRYVRRVLNCFDESALELALRLSDSIAQRGGSARLAALSIGGRGVDPHLTTLLALGYERAARLDVETDLDFAPAVVATLIARYVARREPCDLLLLGCRSGPGDGGTVPFRVAEALVRPCVSQVTEVEPLADDDGCLRVACTTDDGLVRLTVRRPVVLAVGNAVVSRLRVPTLRDRLARRDVPVAVVAADELGVDVAAALDREPTALCGLEVVDCARSGAVVDGAGPRDKARVLYDSYLRALLEAP
jgi:electron transfer flavoprotein beta subunit